jgi:hypothetical protein
MDGWTTKVAPWAKSICRPATKSPGASPVPSFLLLRRPGVIEDEIDAPVCLSSYTLLDQAIDAD